jgi:hypothetical protein
MKPIATALIVASLLCAPFALLNAQSSSPGGSPKASTDSAPTGFTDIYHVHFAKAAAGKTAQMADNLKKPDPQAPMPGHVMVLRHQSGEPWDFFAVEHFGTKATVDANRPPVPPAERNLGDWHNDTYASGPSWADFTKEMGLDAEGKAKSAESVYVVSTYRALTGQRDELQKFLSQPPDRPSDTSAGTVLFQHMEGSEWNFVTIVRYNSWEEFAKNESNSVANTAKNQGGWYKLRELIASHADTVTVRIAP